MKYIEPTAINAAESQDVAEQIEIELKILAGFEQSLRLVLQWKTRDRGNGRKLSTLRLVARAFERQLSRTRVLADYGGYLNLIREFAPQLLDEVRSLSNQREKLQAELERIILRLEYVSADDGSGFGRVCEALGEHLRDLSAHGQNELGLLQRAFARNPDQFA